jgi:cellulose biosynthesis protein BcsQ
VLDRLTNGIVPERTAETGTLSQQALAIELARLEGGAFDYVLLDCPGGQPFMEKQALLAADEVIVLTGLSVIDLYATAPTLDLIQRTQRVRGDGRPSLLGFLPNEAGKGGIPAKLQARLDVYDLPCFTPVRGSALLKTINSVASVERRFIVLARPENPAAQSYCQIAREIELGIEPARQPLTLPVSAATSAEPIPSAVGSLPWRAARGAPQRWST